MPVILQDLFRQCKDWQPLADAGAGSALIGISWPDVERQKGVYDFASISFHVRGALDAGLEVIIRTNWPCPSWAPAAWAAKSATGISSFDSAYFLRMGMCPSFWNDAPWRALFRLQDALCDEFGRKVRLSPPLGGGGETTYSTGHGKIRDDPRIRELWCFDDAALADWKLLWLTGIAKTEEPPRTVAEMRASTAAWFWYGNALKARIISVLRHTPFVPWLGVIPAQDPHLYEDCICAGQLGLDHWFSQLNANIIIHCLYPPGSQKKSHDYGAICIDRWMRENPQRRVAVGVEGIAGMPVNAQRLALTAATDLLVSVDGLDGPGAVDSLRVWCRYWSEIRKEKRG